MGWQVTKPFIVTLVIWIVAVLLFVGSERALKSGTISSDAEIAVNTLALGLLAGWLVWLRVGQWHNEPVIKTVLEGFITMPPWVKLLLGSVSAVAGVFLATINHPYAGLFFATGVFFIVFELFLQRNPATDEPDDAESRQE